MLKLHNDYGMMYWVVLVAAEESVAPEEDTTATAASGSCTSSPTEKAHLPHRLVLVL
jgi:hypothetical protein